eukprot:s3720_g6.t1
MVRVADCRGPSAGRVQRREVSILAPSACSAHDFQTTVRVGSKLRASSPKNPLVFPPTTDLDFDTPWQSDWGQNVVEV